MATIYFILWTLPYLLAYLIVAKEDINKVITSLFHRWHIHRRSAYIVNDSLPPTDYVIDTPWHSFVQFQIRFFHTSASQHVMFYLGYSSREHAVGPKSFKMNVLSVLGSCVHSTPNDLLQAEAGFLLTRIQFYTRKPKYLADSSWPAFLLHIDQKGFGCLVRRSVPVPIYSTRVATNCMDSSSKNILLNVL